MITSRSNFDNDLWQDVRGLTCGPVSKWLFLPNITGAVVWYALAGVREALESVRDMENLVTGTRPEVSGLLERSLNGQSRTWSASNDIGIDCEPLLSAWEALDGRVRLVLSRTGKVIAHSEGARRLLDQNECLIYTSISTLACAASSEKRLQLILGVAPGAVATVALPKRSGNGHFVVSATGISADTVAVAVRDAGSAFVMVLADLEEAFGLTRCEVQVIEKLMSGHVPQQIADELAISVHTVRAHLRHCYDKLHVSSREELWQRLAPYRLN